ncbi:NYN domain-containing protein [Sinorhizobium meliloti]|nr:NYN domain-containing protein [Sinorhizobium meliloti]
MTGDDRLDSTSAGDLPSRHEDITANERAWVEFLRLVSADSDPPPTLTRIQRLRGVFDDTLACAMGLDANPDAGSPPSTRMKRLAVLIDCENLSPKSIPGVLEEVAELGAPLIVRGYGNFAGFKLKSWTEVLLKHAIEPRQQFASAPGKNSTDILMTIDAMDLLHKREADRFCLVTSDGDFAPLIRRMRNEGLEVYGFGSPNALASFRRTCSGFFFVENLEPGAPANNPNSRKKPLRPVTDAVPILKAVMLGLEFHDGWISLDVLGEKLARESNEFDVRTYGYRKLKDLLSDLPGFVVDHPPLGLARVKLRDNR